MKRDKIFICEICYFFEYFEKPITLSFVGGHCKLLEMINNKRIVKCSGIEGCIANEDLHILENELTDEQKKIFAQFYDRKKDLLKQLDEVSQKLDYEYDEFDDFEEYKNVIGLDDIEWNEEEELENIKMELSKLSVHVKKYFYTVSDLEYPKKWVV